MRFEGQDDLVTVISFERVPEEGGAANASEFPPDRQRDVWIGLRRNACLLVLASILALANAGSP